MERQQVTKTNQGYHQKDTQFSAKLALSTRIPFHPILQFQQTIGNRAFGRFIQAKLKIGQPGDVYEQEADRVAEWVVGGETQHIMMPHLSPSSVSDRVHRLAADRDPFFEDAEVGKQEEEEMPSVQRLTQNESPGKISGSDAGSSLDLATQLDSSRNGGEPLTCQARQFMEERFNVDFNGVRIHSDSETVWLSSALNARAFTYGSHIYFSPGEYQPETNPGKKVLAHELTHVVQQGGASQKTVSLPDSYSLSPSQHTAPVVQRLSPLDTSRVVRYRVRPWGGTAPEGTDYKVQTDAGNDVTAWVAYSPYREPLRYWCHGLSLGTYERDPLRGYSVYSGPPMQRVVQDEWRSITPNTARAGDIAVWLPNYDHSARFTSVVTSAGAIDETTSRLNTKNGQNPLRNDSLAGIIGVYGSIYGTCRRK